MAYHVFLVDDDRFLLDLYAVKFKNAGHEVTVFGGGEDLLTALRKEGVAQPDAILLDLIMPQMSGMDVLTRLKNQPETQKIPVIMLTNIDDITVIQEAQRKGADGFLVKAYYQPEELRAHVENLIK